jgi:hypothetical protein
MAWMEETDGNGKEKELGGDNGFLKVKEPSVSSGGSVGDDTISENQRSEVKTIFLMPTFCVRGTSLRILLLCMSVSWRVMVEM